MLQPIEVKSATPVTIGDLTVSMADALRSHSWLHGKPVLSMGVSRVDREALRDIGLLKLERVGASSLWREYITQHGLALGAEVQELVVSERPAKELAHV